MRCFVVTRKHIIAAVSIIAVLTMTFVLKQSISNAIPTFGSKTELPDKDGLDIIKIVKSKIGDILSVDTQEILSESSVVFDVPIESCEPTSEPTPAPTREATAPPIAEQKVTESTANIKNETSYAVNIKDFSNVKCEFPKNSTVLIVHTHTTESYASEDGKTTNRSVDENKNMIAVGEVMKQKLEERGIKVIHDKTVHDYPSYQGAYGRSLKTIENDIKNNSDIAVVLDLHRDAIIKANGSPIKLSCEIGNKKYAQVMAVCGTNNSGLNHPNWKSNLNFAIKLTDEINKNAKGIMRPINLRQERFNQHLTEKSLILEFGTNANTLDEAKNSAEAVASSLADLMKP